LSERGTENDYDDEEDVTRRRTMRDYEEEDDGRG
jgi:hypothetical protein